MKKFHYITVQGQKMRSTSIQKIKNLLAAGACFSELADQYTGGHHLRLIYFLKK